MKRALVLTVLSLAAAAAVEASDTIVKLNPHISIEALLNVFPGQLVGEMSDQRLYLVRFSPGGPSAETLNQMACVTYSEQDSEVHAPECLQSAIWLQGFQEVWP